jgi:hypothetical protein
MSTNYHIFKSSFIAFIFQQVSFFCKILPGYYCPSFEEGQYMLRIQGGCYLCWLVHGSVLHGDRCTIGCKVDTDFADESICLLADNIEIEVLRIHRSQKVLKMLSPSIADRSHHRRQTVETNCKNEPCQLNHTAIRRGLLLWGLSFSNCVAPLALDFDTPVSWARCCSDFLGVCLSLAPMSS